MLTPHEQKDAQPLDIAQVIKQRGIAEVIALEARGYVEERLVENEKQIFSNALDAATKEGATANNLIKYAQADEPGANSQKIFRLLKIYEAANKYLTCEIFDSTNRARLWSALIDEIQSADNDLTIHYGNYRGEGLIPSWPAKYVARLVAISKEADVDVENKEFIDIKTERHKYKYKEIFAPYLADGQKVTDEFAEQKQLKINQFLINLLKSKDAESLDNEQIVDFARYAPDINFYEIIESNKKISSDRKSILKAALLIIPAIHSYKSAVSQFNKDRSEQSISSMINCAHEISKIAAEAKPGTESIILCKFVLDSNKKFIDERLDQFSNALRIADDKLKESNQEGISTREAQILVDRMTISTSSNIGTRAFAYSVKASAISKDNSIAIGTSLLFALLVINPTVAQKSINNLINIQDKDTTFNFFKALPSRRAKLEFVKLLFECDYSFLTANKEIEQEDINKYINELANYSPEETFNIFVKYKESEPGKSEALAIAILNNRQMREWIFSQENNKESYQSLIHAIKNQIGDEKVAPQSNIKSVFSEWNKNEFGKAIEFSSTEEDKQLICWAMLTNPTAVSDMKLDQNEYFSKLNWDYLTDEHIRLIPKENRIAYLKYLENLTGKKTDDVNEFTWSRLKTILGNRNGTFDLETFRERAKAFTSGFEPNEIVNASAPFVIQLLSLNNPNAVKKIIKSVLKGSESHETRRKAWAILHQMDNPEGLLDADEMEQMKLKLNDQGTIASYLASYITDSQAAYKYQLMLAGFCHYNEESDFYKPSLTPYVKTAFLEDPDTFCKYSTVAALKIIKEDPECTERLNANGYQKNKYIQALRGHYTKNTLLESQKSEIGRMLGKETFSNPKMREQFMQKHREYKPADALIKRIIEGLLWGALLGLGSYYGAKLIETLTPNITSFVTNLFSTSSALATLAGPVISGVAMTASILTGAGVAATVAYTLAPVLLAAAVGAIAFAVYNVVKKPNLTKSVINAVTETVAGITDDQLDYVTLTNGIRYWNDVSNESMHTLMNDDTQREILAKNILYHKDMGYDISKEKGISPSTQNILKLLCDQQYYENKPAWKFIVNAIYFVPYVLLSIVTLGNASRILTPPWSLSSKVENAIKSDQANRLKTIEAKQNNVDEEVILSANPLTLLSRRKKSVIKSKNRSPSVSSVSAPSSSPIRPAIAPSTSSSSLSEPPAFLASRPTPPVGTSTQAQTNDRSKKKSAGKKLK